MSSLLLRTNIPSMEAQKNLGISTRALAVSFNRLSSDKRIIAPADDAAGLAISESMKSQSRSFVVAERNASDAISMVQTAEGALSEVHSIMGRMRELAMQGANGSYTSTDRGYLDVEYQAHKAEVQRIQQAATFNGGQLLASNGENIQFHVGLNNVSTDQLILSFSGFGLPTIMASTNQIGGSSVTSAQGALGVIDASLSIISTTRARFGAAMNRLNITASSIQTMRLNLAAANSRIEDVDVAMETSGLTKDQVLSQSAVSVLAQTNQLPQLALSSIQ